MIAQDLCREITVAREDGLHGGGVLRQRLRHAVARAQLHAPIRRQAAMQDKALIGQKRVVAGLVDCRMECRVLEIIGFGIAGLCRLLARGMRGRDGGLVLRGMAARRQPSAGGFQLGHGLEHLDQPAGIGRTDDRTAAGANLHQAGRREMQQRFPDRCPRNSEFGSQRGFFQTRPRGQSAGDDLVLDGLSQP